MPRATRSFTHMSESMQRLVDHCQDLFAEAWREADTHKWIESKKRGCDMGDSARREWFRLYWKIFCRRKWLQHLEGKARWDRFKPDRFGTIRPVPAQENRLFCVIWNLAYYGEENLDIYFLMRDLPGEEVTQVLQMLDINAARMDLPCDNN